MTRPNLDDRYMGKFTRVNNPDGRTLLSHDVTSSSVIEKTKGTVSRRKPTGWLEPTPYEFDREVTRNPVGSCKTLALRSNGQVQVDYTDSGVLSNSAYWQSVFDRQPIINQLDRWKNDTLIDARLNLKDQNVNLGLAFAERNKTANLVTNTANRLVQSIRNLRRGRWRQAAKWLGYKPSRRPNGSIPQQWLEYQYGWRPLLGEIHGAVEEVTKLPREHWRVTARGNRRSKIHNYSRVEVGDLYYYPFQSEATGWYGASTRIDAVPQNDLLIDLASVGITNPLAIGWELVPFSFVIDWMLPVGDFLNSLDAHLGYTDAVTVTSTFIKCEVNAQLLSGERKFSSGTVHQLKQWSSASPYSLDYVRLRRTVQKGIPFPGFRISPGSGLSLNRMANALSILALNFR